MCTTDFVMPRGQTLPRPSRLAFAFLWFAVVFMVGFAEAQPVVSIDASPTVVSETDPSPSLTLTFSVDGEIPTPVFDADGLLISGGLSILFDSRDTNALFAQTSGGPIVDGFVVGNFFDVRFGFELILLQPVSSVMFNILDDVVQEPDREFTFGILPNSSGILNSQYRVNPAASSRTVTLTDGRGGPGIGPAVGLSIDQTAVREGDGLTIRFTVDGEVGTDGLRVLVGSPRAGALQELVRTDASGNPVAELRGIANYQDVGGLDDGQLLVTVTEPEASITLPVDTDGLDEGDEFWTFHIVDGEVYEVVPSAASDSVIFQDQGGPPPKGNLSSELRSMLDTTLDAVRPEGVPGAAAAIVSADGDWFGASGVSDIANDTPLLPADRFAAGSITKTFVATTILQMVEEGRLSLSDTLTDWLPEALTRLVPNAEAITIKQILGHTSGVADYLVGLSAQASTNPTVFFRDWEPAQLIAFIVGVPPLFDPGTAWEYSNTNYILAGLVIEAVSGRGYAQEIRDRILNPLKLQDTFIAVQEDIPGGYINGYLDFDGNGTLDEITRFTNLSWAGSAGSLVSNTADLAAFFDSLFKGQLLTPETLAQMLTTIPVNSPNYDAYGLGIGVLISANRFWYAHRGQTLVFRANLWYSPLEDITYVDLLNRRSNGNLAGTLLPAFRNGLGVDTAVDE